MTVLSGQTIRRRAILEPFCERTLHALSELSYGVGPAGYDVRVREAWTVRPGEFVLLSTLEHFAMPDDVLGRVHDKSSLARCGIAVQTTVIEPGWRGYLTLEISNHGSQIVHIHAGQPIAQIVFDTLDQPAERPYAGRYQDQPSHPVSMLHAHPGSLDYGSE